MNSPPQSFSCWSPKIDSNWIQASLRHGNQNYCYCGYYYLNFELRKYSTLIFSVEWQNEIVMCFLQVHKGSFSRDFSLTMFNRPSRRKRGMASNPLFIIQDFFLHFPKWTLLWQTWLSSFGECKEKPGIPFWGWTPCLFPSKTCC